ncbi:uncharacterized protein LOC110430718 isoform X2 [Sorghum bicolor]|uniref:uncharacterized protein LOC110430718 isoform X2 n=1 Tax=Sorghum bicolor TaxID=4558 RepID=UPI000B425743|nr:uncharacterized protein LOC110430718 isoform X2 [Sorghum bicolor]|eukprot:XP_021304247.1 uncharacterized protein LOC110430718 isoform X2 [Sorghum bicolor]
MDEADDELRTLKVGFTASGEEQFRKLVAEKLRGFKRDVDHTLVEVLATSLWLEFVENASPDNLVDVILVFQYDCAVHKP